jgi:hypothetical protein
VPEANAGCVGLLFGFIHVHHKVLWSKTTELVSAHTCSSIRIDTRNKCATCALQFITRMDQLKMKSRVMKEKQDKKASKTAATKQLDEDRAGHKRANQKTTSTANAKPTRKATPKLPADEQSKHKVVAPKATNEMPEAEGQDKTVRKTGGRKRGSDAVDKAEQTTESNSKDVVTEQTPQRKQTRAVSSGTKQKRKRTQDIIPEEIEATVSQRELSDKALPMSVVESGPQTETTAQLVAASSTSSIITDLSSACDIENATPFVERAKLEDISDNFELKNKPQVMSFHKSTLSVYWKRPAVGLHIKQSNRQFYFSGWKKGIKTN